MKLLYNTLTQTLHPYPRADDEDVVGLSEEYATLTVVEIEAPAYNSQTELLVPAQDVDIESGTVTRGWTIEAIQLLPVKSITMRSLRLTLIDLGLYQTTLAAINGIPDETERLKAQVWWESSPVVFRDNPYVVNIGAVLGKSEIEIDQIFSAAKLLDLP